MPHSMSQVPYCSFDWRYMRTASVKAGASTLESSEMPGEGTGGTSEKPGMGSEGQPGSLQHPQPTFAGGALCPPTPSDPRREPRAVTGTEGSHPKLLSLTGPGAAVSQTHQWLGRLPLHPQTDPLQSWTKGREAPRSTGSAGASSDPRRCVGTQGLGEPRRHSRHRGAASPDGIRGLRGLVSPDSMAGAGAQQSGGAQ